MAGTVVSALHCVAGRRAREQVNGPHHRSDQSFDVPAPMRLRRRPIVNLDPILLDATRQCLRVEFLGVVKVDAVRNAMHWPCDVHPPAPQVFVLRKHTVAQHHRHGQRRGSLKTQIKSRDHPGCYVDRQRQPRSADRQPAPLGHHDDVGQRMVDLHQRKWAVRHQVTRDSCRLGAGASRPAPVVQHVAQFASLHAGEHRLVCWRA